MQKGGGKILTWELVKDALLDALTDSVKILPILFLTYLLIEYVEHHMSQRMEHLIRKAGRLGPLFGGALGVIPQCGLSGAAAEFYDYDDKYKNGAAQLFIPARLDPEIAEEIRKTAVRAYNLLGCDGLSRVDFFVTTKEKKVILNEINTLPGFTSISMYPKLWGACGVPYGELLEKLIDCALTRNTL